MPRPTKLTPDLTDKLVRAIKAGNRLDVAARYAGISETTYHRWMQEGETAKSGAKREFWETVMEARAIAEVSAVSVILSAARSGSWRAAAWWLERRYPQEYGRVYRGTIEHTGAAGGPIEHVTRSEDPGVADAARDFLAKLEEERRRKEAGA